MCIPSHTLYSVVVPTGGLAAVGCGVDPWINKRGTKRIKFFENLQEIYLEEVEIELNSVIRGSSKQSEKVRGTSGDDLIADGRGRDKLIGGKGSDQFYFSGNESFKKKSADRIIDFNAKESDSIVIAKEVFGDLDQDPIFAIAESKWELKQLAATTINLVYLKPEGHLYINGNGMSEGFGENTEGGIIANLPKGTILTEGDVLIGV